MDKIRLVMHGGTELLNLTTVSEVQTHQHMMQQDMCDTFHQIQDAAVKDFLDNVKRPLRIDVDVRFMFPEVLMGSYAHSVFKGLGELSAVNLQRSSASCAYMLLDDSFCKFEIHNGYDDLTIDAINGRILAAINSPIFMKYKASCMTYIQHNGGDEYVFNPELVRGPAPDEQFVAVEQTAKEHILHEMLMKLYPGNAIPIYASLESRTSLKHFQNTVAAKTVITERIHGCNLHAYIASLKEVTQVSDFIHSGVFRSFLKELVNVGTTYGFVHNDCHYGNLLLSIGQDRVVQGIRLIDFGRMYVDAKTPGCASLNLSEIAKSEKCKMDKDMYDTSVVFPGDYLDVGYASLKALDAGSDFTMYDYIRFELANKKNFTSMFTNPYLGTKLMNIPRFGVVENNTMIRRWMFMFDLVTITLNMCFRLFGVMSKKADEDTSVEFRRALLKSCGIIVHGAGIALMPPDKIIAVWMESDAGDLLQKMLPLFPGVYFFSVFIHDYVCKLDTFQKTDGSWVNVKDFVAVDKDKKITLVHFSKMVEHKLMYNGFQVREFPKVVLLKEMLEKMEVATLLHMMQVGFMSIASGGSGSSTQDMSQRASSDAHSLQELMDEWIPEPPAKRSKMAEQNPPMPPAETLPPNAPDLLDIIDPYQWVSEDLDAVIYNPEVYEQFKQDITTMIVEKK